MDRAGVDRFGEEIRRTGDRLRTLARDRDHDRPRLHFGIEMADREVGIPDERAAGGASGLNAVHARVRSNDSAGRPILAGSEVPAYLHPDTGIHPNAGGSLHG